MTYNDYLPTLDASTMREAVQQNRPTFEAKGCRITLYLVTFGLVIGACGTSYHQVTKRERDKRKR